MAPLQLHIDTVNLASRIKQSNSMDLTPLSISSNMSTATNLSTTSNDGVDIQLNVGSPSIATTPTNSSTDDDNSMNIKPQSMYKSCFKRKRKHDVSDNINANSHKYKHKKSYRISSIEEQLKLLSSNQQRLEQQISELQNDNHILLHTIQQQQQPNINNNQSAVLNNVDNNSNSNNNNHNNDNTNETNTSTINRIKSSFTSIAHSFLNTLLPSSTSKHLNRLYTWLNTLGIQRVKQLIYMLSTVMLLFFVSKLPTNMISHITNNNYVNNNPSYTYTHRTPIHQQQSIELPYWMYLDHSQFLYHYTNNRNNDEQQRQSESNDIDMRSPTSSSVATTETSQNNNDVDINVDLHNRSDQSSIIPEQATSSSLPPLAATQQPANHIPNHLAHSHSHATHHPSISWLHRRPMSLLTSHQHILFRCRSRALQHSHSAQNQNSNNVNPSSASMSLMERVHSTFSAKNLLSTIATVVAILCCCVRNIVRI